MCWTTSTNIIFKSMRAFKNEMKKGGGLVVSANFFFSFFNLDNCLFLGSCSLVVIIINKNRFGWFYLFDERDTNIMHSN